MPTSSMLATSGEYEYYTPLPIVEAARATMGGIDLDPASSAIANARIRATNFYTEEDDGLTIHWSGRIWLNHPFGRGLNEQWIEMLVGYWTMGEIKAACSITYAATSEKWFRPLLQFPQCFLTPRTNYLLPDGSVKKGVQKGSVVTYLGPDLEAFRYCFRDLGVVKV